MWTTRSPGVEPLEDVARDDPPHRLRPADADRPEQLAVGDEGEAVRAADEAAVEAALDRARWRRAAAPPRPDRRPPTGWPASPRSSASRGAWSEARTIRAPSARQRSTASTSRPARPGGRTGSRQPNRSPEDSAPRAIAASSGGIGLPGQLERPRRRRGGSSSRAAAGRSTASPSAGRRPRPARRAARRPGATGSSAASAMSPGSSRTRSVPGSRWSRPVAGARWAAQTSAASPTARRPASPSAAPRRRCRGVAAPRSGRGPRRAARGAARRRGRVGRGSRPRRRPAGGTPSPAAGPRSRSSVPTVRWSVGSNERSESISSPKNSIRIGSGIDGGKTSTIPPRRANSPRPATSVTGT